jgi:hypothetical protein
VEAALKCLLSLWQPKRVPLARFEVLVESANETLRDCAFLTLAIDGSFPPSESFESLLEALASIQRTQVAVVAAYRSANLAQMFVTWLEMEAISGNDGVVRRFLCVARHSGLRRRIVALIRKWLGEDIDILNMLQPQPQLEL